MATIEVKFRPSRSRNGEGTVYYQVTYNRTVRQARPGYRITEDEWANEICPIANGETIPLLSAVGRDVREDIGKMEAIIAEFDRKPEVYTASDVVTAFAKCPNERIMLLSFMRSVAATLKERGKVRLSDAYASTANSFARYRKGVDVPIESVDVDMMCGYEAYMLNSGICKNTTSFYMRNLRAIYNRAVDYGLTMQHNPFRRVYTGIDKTAKRAVPLISIKKIRELDLCDEPGVELARDMFLFSFYTRGMSFVDMAYLKKSDIRNGTLTYVRKKTGQRLLVRVEKCMLGIIDKYSDDSSPYLLPIIKEESMERRHYLNASHLINRNLKTVGKKAGISVPLTMYVARHAWASIAKSKNIPMSVISEGMGHDNENTTRIYLASLDTAIVDNANRLILKDFE